MKLSTRIASALSMALLIGVACGPKSAPRLSGANWTPTARSVSAGSARIAIPANWDRDDLNLTYELYEQGKPYREE